MHASIQGLWCNSAKMSNAGKETIGLALGGENSRPSLRSSSGSARQLSRLELMFPNLLCELDAADRDCRRFEPFESEHRPDPVFDSAMILLYNVI